MTKDLMMLYYDLSEMVATIDALKAEIKRCEARASHIRKQISDLVEKEVRK